MSANIDIEDLVLDDLIKLPSDFDSKCIRSYSNWPSHDESTNYIDNPINIANGVNAEVYNVGINLRTAGKVSPLYTDTSPKIETLLKNIQKLDKKDLEETGKLYKHFIFTDLKSSTYGAKMIGSALVSNGYKLAYDAVPFTGNAAAKKKKIFNKIHLLSENTLSSTKSNNFYILSSTTMFDQPISVELKKQMLANFNKRPNNVYGENVRFIIMDSGYKEGIDLFDIKYVHVFEPQNTIADQRQVIGRGTRTCGQKGLDFHPTHGWVLDVFIYDLSVPTSLVGYFNNSKTIFELYMESLKRDKRLLALATEIENVAIEGAVDYHLNRPIHEFNQPASAKETSEKEKSVQPSDNVSPQTHLDYKEMHKYIDNHFKDCEWDTPKMENGCVTKGGARNASAINYTPTQQFVSNYFSPQLFAKGMLLWHSVGTGKTCSAIASISNDFEKQGYNILWVTRTTLRSDVWKNIFSQVCHTKLRDRLNENENFDIPTNMKDQFKLLSKAWRIRPISYKQFSNLVSKKNTYYERLVKLNGAADPLRKTVIVIDEAHKLYGVSDLSTIEKPDMNKFHEALMNSYTVSGADSAKVLLMTATPITENPLELVKLINLCKPIENQMPSEINHFADRYLNEEGFFTKEGERKFKDDISGYISYLNRERDARTFSQPKLHYLNASLTDEVKMQELDRKLVLHQYMNKIEDSMKYLRDTTKSYKIVRKQKRKDLGGLDCPEEYTNTKKLLARCKKIQNKTKKVIMGEMKERKTFYKEEVQKTRDRTSSLKAMKRSDVDIIKSKLRRMDMDDIPKNTAYYKLSRKCRMQPTFNQTLQMYINNNVVADVNQRIARYEEIGRALNTKLKQYRKSHNQTKKKYKPPKNAPIDPAEEERYKNDMKFLRDELKQKIDETATEIEHNAALLSQANLTRKREISRAIPRIRKTLKAKEAEMIKDQKDNEEVQEIIKKGIDQFNKERIEMEEQYYQEEAELEAKKKANEAAKAARAAKRAAKDAEMEAKGKTRKAKPATANNTTKKKAPCKYGERDENGKCPPKPKAAAEAKPCKYGERDASGKCPPKPKTTAEPKPCKYGERDASGKCPPKPKAEPKKKPEPEPMRRPAPAPAPMKEPESENNSNCPSYGKPPQRCMSRKDYITQTRVFHPDKNVGCSNTATKKFQLLQQLCSPYVNVN